MQKGNIVTDLKNLKIKKTAKTPEVDFNPKEGCLAVSGISVPEDSLSFYLPLINWLKEYINKPAVKTEFTFKLAYVNTSSLQALYDILFLLDEINTKSFEVIVNWYYLDEDIDMKEVGEDLEEALSISFNYCVVEDV